MKVIYARIVTEYWKELINILYQRRYFGAEGLAVQYVDLLIKEIETTLSYKQKRTAPRYFCRYGKQMAYCCYPKSKLTTWYVFFTLHSPYIYQVKYISNNHIEGQYL